MWLKNKFESYLLAKGHECDSTLEVNSKAVSNKLCRLKSRELKGKNVNLLGFESIVWKLEKSVTPFSKKDDLTEGKEK